MKEKGACHDHALFGGAFFPSVSVVSAHAVWQLEK